MSTDKSGEGGQALKGQNFRSIPTEWLAAIISYTCPADACRLSVVSTSFQLATDSDIVWSKFLPTEYKTPASLEYWSKKRIYLSMCRPFPLENGRKTFEIDRRTGRKRYMQSARDITITWSDHEQYWTWSHSPDTRFKEVCILEMVWWFEIRGKFPTRLLSPKTNYKACVVAKMVAGAYGFKDHNVQVTCGLAGTEEGNTKRTIDVDPGDDGGWFDIDMGEFYNNGDEDGELEMSLMETEGHVKHGIIVQGIEIKPSPIKNK